MNKLGWLPLEEQRAKHKVNIFFKAMQNEIKIPIEEFKMKSQIFAWLGGDFLAWWLFFGLVVLSWFGIVIPRPDCFSPHAQNWKS